jgi:AhpD family alkylhydroperoxidase
MSARLSYAEFGKSAASARAALTALSKSAAELGLDQAVSELVKLRVSQINGCAFCIAYHLKVLRGLGVAQGKLDLIAAWRESPDYTPAERAALDWAEAMSRIAIAAPDEVGFQALAAHFNREQVIGLNITIATINAWNRLGVAFGFSPADAG